MILLDNPILLLIIMILIAISLVAIVFSVVAYTKYSELSKRYEIFMTGKDAETLEDFFIALQSDLDYVIEDNTKIKNSLRKLNKTARKSIQKVGLHRYDAFEEKSGKRSFALALLDFTNSGIILTFQNVGDGTIIFVKEVELGATNTKLGPEEEKALEIAMGQRDKNEAS